MTTSDARIEGIVARGANVAVIFRRGPTRETQMLLWNLNTDEVTPGQWIRARVNVRECDVTPDGRLLVAGLYDGASRREPRSGARFGISGWTAISRPPYFTALALWFNVSGLGGSWSSDRDLHLFGSLATDPPVKGDLERRIRRHEWTRERPVFETRLTRDGWVRKDATRSIRVSSGWSWDRLKVRELKALGVDMAALEALHPHEYPRDIEVGTSRWEREFPGGRLVRLESDVGQETLIMEDDRGERRWERAHASDAWRWFDLDANGRIIYGDRGCLWAWADFPDGGPTMVADLNANRFRAISPPDWAREWPSNEPPEW